MGGAFKILNTTEIIGINRRMIAEFGGIFFQNDDNLRNPGSLEHALEEIQGSLFGIELYPSIFQKASLVGWRIIAYHVFHDGNKRTGIEVTRLILDINGYTMRIDLTIVEAALAIADGRMDLNQYINWVQDRTNVSE
jgi:death on curing protein